MCEAKKSANDDESCYYLLLLFFSFCCLLLLLLALLFVYFVSEQTGESNFENNIHTRVGEKWKEKKNCYFWVVEVKWGRLEQQFQWLFTVKWTALLCLPTPPCLFLWVVELIIINTVFISGGSIGNCSARDSRFFIHFLILHKSTATSARKERKKKLFPNSNNIEQFFEWVFFFFLDLVLYTPHI